LSEEKKGDPDPLASAGGRRAVMIALR